jgi:RecB family exonuclease
MGYAKAWSFSALRDFEQCPHRIKLKAEKAPVLEEEENRGTVIHREAEMYIKGELDAMPKSLKKFEAEFERERELYAAGLVQVEQPWGFTHIWTPTDYFAPDIWLRVQIDSMERMPDDLSTRFVVDWKTGKSWGNEVPHIQQLQLYAVATFMRFPEVGTVVCADRYLDEGKELKKTYVRDDKFDRYFEKWNQRAEKMLADDEGTPKPNRMNCRFCRYGVEKGSGACAYAVPWN